jgi:hypothetical protein
MWWLRLAVGPVETKDPGPVREGDVESHFMGDQYTDDDDDTQPKERSAVAANIESLQATVKRLAEERDVLPQPLFWSLFHSRLASIKKQKEISRVVSEVLGES